MVTGTLSQAAETDTIDSREIAAKRAMLDDPRPMPDYVKEFLSPEEYAFYSFDPEAAKALMAEAVGFKAPDVVGKIAPEITPGKYTHNDKGNKPGLKALMIPFMYENLFRPAGPPLGATFSEFTVVPTWQYNFGKRYLEATIKNSGQVKVDAQGFMDWKGYKGGLLFPKPSGTDRQKAMQVLYNWLYMYWGADSSTLTLTNKSWDKNFRVMTTMKGASLAIYPGGRVQQQPLGWLDERAQQLGQFKYTLLNYLEPRDMYGTSVMIEDRMDPEAANAFYMYTSLLRRVRKMTGSDVQEVSVGGNVTYDDGGGFHRKLSATQFPYEYKILDDREYLVPEAMTPGATFFITSKDLELKNLKMVRRPLYVFELIQQDSTYIYRRTILYFDKEAFNLYLVENYDQKDRLYRAHYLLPCFDPKTGMWAPSMYTPNYDLRMKQTGIGFQTLSIPQNYTRDQFNLGALGGSVK
ncbi:MAG: DUF1329 domain-containing protein [Desulfatitalea sp.]|nr:DUF1329 domain-containing protein [Desulfatitalea sp.]NNJ99728.1 DUF1329 domain-containing protein [Desulfatitalea sp.]